MMLPGAFDLFKNLLLANQKRNTRLLANFVLTEVYTYLKEQKMSYTELPIDINFIGQCIDLLQADQITEGVAFDLLHIRKNGDERNATEIVKENKWTKSIEQEVIRKLVQEAIDYEPFYSSVYAKKGKPFALNQILSRLDIIGRKTVSRNVAKFLIDEILRNKSKS